MPEIQFKRPDGGETRGYLVEPTGPAKGNVVVIQEWWGLNAQIKKIADRAAAAGFRALAPDLYKGKIAADAAEARHEMGHLNWGEAVSQDLAGAVAHVKALGGKTATLGFCMGGALTLLSAMHLAVDAAVCFYGIPPAEAGDPATIKAPLLAHWASEDDWCNAAAIAQLESRLKAGGVDYAFHRYQAKHAFMNEGRPEVYVDDVAKLAWSRSLEFLSAKLA